MTITDRDVEPEPATEVIDRLCFTIQRQSATCLEYVKHGIEAEREECARLAEREAAALAREGKAAEATASQRIADSIRGRADNADFLSTTIIHRGTV